MRRLHLTLRRLLWLVAFVCVALLAYGAMRQRPQDLPWTPLDMDQPVGLFTGRKLAALTGDAAGCGALLDRAGVDYVAMEPGGAGQCRYADAVRLRADKGAIALAPAAVAPSCPVVAALKLWEWQVVQPAAQRIYGAPVRSIRHFGSYSCRRMYGRSAGDFSEHATADAIDIAAFVLKDGRQVSVLKDWKTSGKDAAFLRAVRDGACGLFSTVLSPDYNAAHRDHFHLDQAERGAMGWRACR
ncbi:extensin [Sphingobium sp. Leaf26]|uniref:extensin-like domain-containing protein n=1 Tax=Sphingobium sp. Leaf26 TaxID=1735693 RepID=UPI0006F5DE0A|nr:extensin family protein [Sphingobium sp. Leaf26]KQN04777.1 extensin [Sphingobium sp. Leaf26]